MSAPAKTDEERAKRAAYNREWRARNPGYHQKWRAKNPDKVKSYVTTEERREYVRQYNEANKDALRVTRRDWALRRQYGITLDDYRRMHEEQAGACAVCRVVPGKGEKSLAVDHCHRTGKVRGLLCGRCNLTLGRFDDCPEVFERLADYLRRTGAK